MLKRRREYLEALFCLILLFVTPLAVSWPAIVRGDAPLNLNPLTLRAPWQPAQAVQVDSENGADASELLERYYPWYVFLNQAREHGELPLWNPYEGMGMPFLALWRTRALSLFSVPFYFLPLGAASAVSAFLKLCIAGLAAYYMARRFQFTPLFALVVAIPFQLSGIFLVSHWHPVSDVAPFFPLLLPCLQRLLLGDRRVWPYIALLTGMMILGGDPESLAAILLFMFALAIIFGIRTYQRERIRGAVICLAVSAILGAALAAIQLAPYIEFLSHGRLENKYALFFSPWDLSAFLAPPVLSRGAFAATASSLWLPAGMIGFLFLPLWLSLRPFAHRIRKRRIEAFLLTSLLMIAIPMLLGGWLRRIPGLALLDASHFMIPFPLAFGLLTATTADEWVHLNAEKCKAALSKLSWLLPLVWGIGLAVVVPLLWFNPAANTSLVQLVPFIICGVLLLALLLITLIWPKPRITAFVIALLTAGALWYVYQPHARTTPLSRVLPETHFTRALTHDDTRVAGSEHLKLWPLSPHGISQVYSPSGVALNRGDAFLAKAAAHPDLLRLTASGQLILTKSDIQERFAALRPVLNIQEVFPAGSILLKDLQAHPRTRVAHTGRTAGEDEARPPLRAAGPPIIEGGTLPGTAREAGSMRSGINHASLNTLYISAESSRPGVLIVADSWYPGWQASVDGSQTPVFPVDIAFRGIEISDGNHEIVLEYKPDSLRWGLYISLVALLLVLWGLRTLFHTRHAAKPL